MAIWTRFLTGNKSGNKKVGQWQNNDGISAERLNDNNQALLNALADSGGPKVYTSSEQVLPIRNGEYSFTHNLGKRPQLVIPQFIAKTRVFGGANVGDICELADASTFIYVADNTTVFDLSFKGITNYILTRSSSVYNGARYEDIYKLPSSWRWQIVCIAF